MNPLVGVIHELPLPTALAIAYLMNHTQIQQRHNQITEIPAAIGKLKT
jgi:hypothetical protein